MLQSVLFMPELQQSDQHGLPAGALYPVTVHILPELSAKAWFTELHLFYTQGEKVPLTASCCIINSDGALECSKVFHPEAVASLEVYITIKVTCTCLASPCQFVL